MNTLSPKQTTINIALLAYDGANAVDVFGPLQVFASANRLMTERLGMSQVRYLTRVVGIADREIRLATGTRILCEDTLEQLTDRIPDTLLIAGGEPAPQ